LPLDGHHSHLNRDRTAVYSTSGISKSFLVKNSTRPVATAAVPAMPASALCRGHRSPSAMRSLRQRNARPRAPTQCLGDSTTRCSHQPTLAPSCPPQRVSYGVAAAPVMGDLKILRDSGLLDHRHEPIRQNRSVDKYHRCPGPADIVLDVRPIQLYSSI